MRVYAASLLLCKNFPLFSWSLNSSLSSLGLYFALLHSEPAWVPGVHVAVGLSPQMIRAGLRLGLSPRAGDDLSVYLSVCHTTVIM